MSALISALMLLILLTGSGGSLTSLLWSLGWTPSTFVSSRQQKADRQNVRPEDFMDEEVCVCALIPVKFLACKFFV